MITLNTLERIVQERERQQTQEGYSLAHDDEREEGLLAILAAYYAITSVYPMQNTIGRHPEWSLLVANTLNRILNIFGWRTNSKNPIRDLERAGALILAELERQLRKEKP